MIVVLRQSHYNRVLHNIRVLASPALRARTGGM